MNNIYNQLNDEFINIKDIDNMKFNIFKTKSNFYFRKYNYSITINLNNNLILFLSELIGKSKLKEDTYDEYDFESNTISFNFKIPRKYFFIKVTTLYGSVFDFVLKSKVVDNEINIKFYHNNNPEFFQLIKHFTES